MGIEDLPDDAVLRVCPCDPPLDATAAADLCTAIDKLLTQFVREGSVQAAACTSAANGAVVLIAWQESGEPLSGCRKDKLEKVLAAHERDGRQLLAAPPVVLARDGAASCHSLGAVKSLAAVGAINADTLVWDTTLQRLGDWRERGETSVAALPWLARRVLA